MVINFSAVRILAATLIVACLALPSSVAANELSISCVMIADSKERLACYDAAMQKVTDVSEFAEDSAKFERSYLTRSWDLDNRDEQLLGEQQAPLRPHRGTYLIVRRTSLPNVEPHSPTHPAAISHANIDSGETKFQISQKAKIFNPLRINFLGFTGLRLWGGYTQQSNWQVFNADNSSPFRETNYEPELMFVFSTGKPYGMKLMNLGYVHQSNGRDLSASRSWNRAYVQGGWEASTFSLMVRGWWRMPEWDGQDDNPDIEEYIGRGEVKLRWEPLDGSQVVDVTFRNNFRLQENRGYIHLDWATPIAVSKSTKLHLQVTSGYGESLIDYNHNQTTIGLGISFRDW